MVTPMANDPERTAFWRDFIGTRCGYPAPRRLSAQLAVAEFFDFCPCGCNSFAVKIPSSAGVGPLAAPNGKYRMVFEANFDLSNEKTLEILLFVDGDGNLAHIEVDCLANTTPVPDSIVVAGPPFSVYASDQLIMSAEG